MSQNESEWGNNTSWDAIQVSLDQAGKMLDRADDLIRAEFEKIQSTGQYRLPINPEMVQSCEKDWVIGLVNMYHNDQLNVATLKQTLKEKDGDVRPLMGEGDAKTLTALIHHVDGQVMDNMMDAVTKQLASAKLHVHLAKDARNFLSDYRQRVYDAYTMGLGKDYKEQWKGKYGHKAEADTQPEWRYPDMPARKTGPNKP